MSAEPSAALHLDYAEAPPTAPLPVRALCIGIILVAVIWFAETGSRHIWSLTADFEFFYYAGSWMLDAGTLDPGYDVTPDKGVVPRGKLDWYLPFVPRLMTMLAWMPHGVAGAIWLGINIIVMISVLRLCGRYLSGLPPWDWPVTQSIPLIFLGLFWYWEMRLNQIDNLTLLLLVGSFVMWQRRRPNLSGFWLGLAVLIKVTPALLVLWFMLKRQWRTVGVAIITVLAFGPISDAIVFGPRDATDIYRGWLQRSIADGSQRALILQQRETDWRNQATAAVICRWLHPSNYALHFDNDPRALPLSAEPRTMNVADLSLPTIATIVTVLLGLALVGMIWIARKPARDLSLWQLRFEWAFFVLAMLWFMPVMRRYHLIWAYPAVAVLGGGIHYAGFRGRWARFGLIAILILVAAQISTAIRIAEAAGSLLAAAILLGLVMLAGVIRLSRDPEALPPDYFVQPPHDDAQSDDASASSAPAHA
jgi:hypothetical protein